MSVNIGRDRVGQVGLGLMGFTWRPSTTPDEQAFDTIKSAIDAGCNLLNGGTFYNRPEEPLANLKLIRRFYEKYPEYVDKTILSIKGCVSSFKPTGTRDGVRTSALEAAEVLKGVKKIDIFEPARVDVNVSIEDTVGYLAELVKEGVFHYIGLSEVNGQTIRRAHKIHPIAAVEVEYSLFSREPESNGVLAACEELDITLVAYSPVGRGLLTGTITSLSDIPSNDMRRQFDRFQEEALEDNLKLVEIVKRQAEKKGEREGQKEGLRFYAGVTPAQLAIAWVTAQSKHIVAIPGSTTQSRATENARAAEVEFTSDEMKELREMVESFRDFLQPIQHNIVSFSQMGETSESRLVKFWNSLSSGKHPKGSQGYWIDKILILLAFSITGSSSSFLIALILRNVFGLQGSLKAGPWSFRLATLILMMPVYSLLLLTIGTLLGRGEYFTKFVKRMWSRFLPRKKVQ
ncbi:hypothetical protein PROFUN_13101 [Planoprotostelium fungivorum]|uniref:Uncharacterized protein n=1 Tax=Planoprotostelium fungivorum TaxID=1890364 RepID=A0A2P6N5C5_9EUKA|nr:hypothetical protein PROFUN_13101 [Planoprotostelium fungivorum]